MMIMLTHYNLSLSECSSLCTGILPNLQYKQIGLIFFFPWISSPFDGIALFAIWSHLVKRIELYTKFHFLYKMERLKGREMLFWFFGKSDGSFKEIGSPFTTNFFKFLNFECLFWDNWSLISNNVEHVQHFAFMAATGGIRLFALNKGKGF